jgi:hypothetical protein
MQSLSSRTLEPLSARDCSVLADKLGDTPQTVITTHILRRGLCKAYVVGNVRELEAAIVRPNALPEELMGFGSDPEAMLHILKLLHG